MIHQVIGTATRNARQISVKKSLDNSRTIRRTDAPIIFRMPISFVRCSALKAASPNNPRQEIKIANTVKELMIRDMVNSVSYILFTSSLRKLYSKGAMKTRFFHSNCILCSSEAYLDDLALTIK